MCSVCSRVCHRAYVGTIWHSGPHSPVHSPIRGLPSNLVSLCLTQARRCQDSTLIGLPHTLKKLEFNANRLTDQALAIVPRGLRHLFISGASSITNPGCSKLPPNLKTFKFSMSAFALEIKDCCSSRLALEGSPQLGAFPSSHLHSLPSHSTFQERIATSLQLYPHRSFI